jgi:hypothetical protein
MKQRYNLFLVVLLLLVVKQSDSQSNFILAGDTIGTEITFRNNLDWILEVNMMGPGHLPIDLNNDGFYDVDFNTQYFHNSPAWTQSYIWVTTLSGTVIALNDTIAKARVFDLGEKIDSNLQWYSGTTTLIFNEDLLMPPFTVWNSGAWLNVSKKYLAIRTIVNNDTVYGWVMLSGWAVGLKIHSYAIQKVDTSAISEFQETNTISTFPNPIKDQLNIVLSEMKNECEISISDLTGKVLLKQHITDKISNVDFSNLVKGIYFLKLINGKQVEVRKIIRE